MIDYHIVCFYLFVTLLIGIYYGRQIENLRDFSICNTGFPTAVLLATLFATVIGGGSTCGIASNVHKYGILFMLAFSGAAINKILVARYVIPKIDFSKNILTFGDIFKEEYGKTGRLIAGLFIFFVSIVCIGQQITALAFVFECFFNLSFLEGALLGYGVLVFYSGFGGIRSVVTTDIFQFIIMIAMIPTLVIYGLDAVGGIESFFLSFPIERVGFSELPREVLLKAFTLFMVMTFSALDPSYFHRIIMAKDKNQAKKITLYTGYLSVPFFFSMGFVGLITFSLFPHINSSNVLPYFIDQTFPVGIRGFAIVGLLATLMSTADSALHSMGVSFVRDLFGDYVDKKSGKKQVMIARMSTIFLGCFSLGICLFVKDIFSILIMAFSFWCPTILVPLLFILHKRPLTKGYFIFVVCFCSFFVLCWNLFLKTEFYVDGFLPGSLLSVFLCCSGRKKNEYE